MLLEKTNLVQICLAAMSEILQLRHDAANGHPLAHLQTGLKNKHV